TQTEAELDTPDVPIDSNGNARFSGMIPASRPRARARFSSSASRPSRIPRTRTALADSGSPPEPSAPSIRDQRLRSAVQGGRWRGGVDALSGDRGVSQRIERSSGIMNRRHLINAAVIWLAAALPAQATTLRGPQDSVRVGNTGYDTDEASLWQIDPANTTLVRKVQTGRVTLTDLTTGGAIPLSLSACSAMDVFTNFPRSGNWTAVPGSNPASPGL